MENKEKQIKQLQKNIKLEPKIIKKIERLKEKCKEKEIEFDGDMQKYHLEKLKATSKASIKLSRLSPVIEQYEAILAAIQADKAQLAELTACEPEF